MRLGEFRVSNAATTPTDPPAPSGERRQVTALFADMVGFTAISERLGEEGTFALIQPIYELMARAVREQGGSVKDFTGDGIMALFGVPDALEDCAAAGLSRGIGDPRTPRRRRPRNRGQTWRAARDAHRRQFRDRGGHANSRRRRPVRRSATR